jgi:hypothetical protein
MTRVSRISSWLISVTTNIACTFLAMAVRSLGAVTFCGSIMLFRAVACVVSAFVIVTHYIHEVDSSNEKACKYENEPKS